MMEEHVLEEPHKIFIPVPDTVFNQDLFNELPADQVEDESMLSSTITVMEEELIGDELDPLTASINTDSGPQRTQCIIKEEIFIDQDEQCVNKNILSHSKTKVNEQVAAWEETHSEDQHRDSTEESESSSSLLRLLLLRQRDHRSVKQQEYVCEVCNKEFKWCSSFYQHKLMNHCQEGSQNNVCNDISKPGDIGVSLAHRSSTVSKDSPVVKGSVKRMYVCDVCNREFRWHSSFSRHKLSHSRHLKHQSDMCNDNSKPVVATEMGVPLTHRRNVVSEDRPTGRRKVMKKYMCDICFKVFISQRAFCQHKILHKLQMNNQNDMCNDSKSVVTTETGISLAQESSTVSEDRPNICAFIQSGTLSKQDNLDHSDVKKYTCEVCNETFSEWSLLTTHKLVRSDINHCNECGQAFANTNDL